MVLFRLESSLDGLDFPWLSSLPFDRYEVDYLQVVGTEVPWLLARLSCRCAPEVIYLAVQEWGFVQPVGVYSLVLRRGETRHVASVPERPSPDRSLLGLAIADGLLEVDATAVDPVEVKSQDFRFLPDPTIDCVACQMVGSFVNAVDAYAARYFGRVNPDSRIEFTSNEGRFVAMVVDTYTGLEDTLILRERSGNVQLLYRYSTTRVPQLKWGETPPLGYLRPDMLFDADRDGYPELAAVQRCHCDTINPLVAVLDTRSWEVVFIEYSGGPQWNASGPIVPYIRPLSGPTQKQASLQDALLSYIDLLALERVTDPGMARPLGYTDDVRVGTIEQID